MTTASERFDPADASWDPVQRELHLQRYRFACQFAPGRRVLDVACGTGYGSRMLEEAGASTVLGIDADAPTVTQAQASYQDSRLYFRCADAETLSLDETYDLIVSFETIEHLNHPEAFLAAVVQRLAPRGRFLVSTPVRRSGALTDRPANPFHVREWTQPEFAELLGRWFAAIEWYGQGIEFRRGRMPLSRTLARWWTRLTNPRQLSFMYTPRVVPLAGLPDHLLVGTMVAVCSRS